MLFRTGPLTARCSIRPTIALVFASIWIGFLSAGCSSDKSATHPTTHDLELEGAQVPEVINEGDSAVLLAWGSTPDGSWSFQRLEAFVIREPNEASGQSGRVEVRAVGTHDDQPGAPTARSFQGSLDLPPLAPGAWIVAVMTPGGSREFPVRVIPRETLVRYRSFDSATEPDQGLMILQNGQAFAFRDGAGMVHPIELPATTLNEIQGWFEAAAFTSLNDRYASDPPGAGRKVEIALRGSASTKSVFAEVALMPDPLAQLEAKLAQLTARILLAAPERPHVRGQIDVDPIAADPGGSRKIHLTLMNEGDSDVVLHFPTTQQYDLLVLGMGADGGPGGSVGGDPGGDDGNGGDGDDDGGHDGRGHGGPGGDGRGHLDPSGDEPPPVRAVIWQWSKDKHFDVTPSELTIAAHDMKVIEETWDGRDLQGNPTQPGLYHVVALIPSDARVPVQPARIRVNGDESPSLGLVGLLSVDPQEAPAGTERTLTLAVTNMSSVALTVQFDTTQRYDFSIVDPRRMEPVGTPGPNFLWRWSATQAFLPERGELLLAAGETQTFTGTWPGTTDQGEQIGPGLYDAVGWLTGRPRVQTRPTPFVVLP